jgi:hypothetical protein
MTASSPSQTGSASIRDLPCEVLITNEIKERFFRVGVSQTSHHEQRRFARFYCGHENNRVAIRYLNNIASLQRSSVWRGGILIDVSRGGLHFLHSEEVYPGEKARLALESGGKLQIFDGEVTWCRRHAPKCFGVGFRFLQSASDSHAEQANPST